MVVPTFDQSEDMETFYLETTKYPSDVQVNELTDKTGLSFQELKVCDFYY